MFGSTLFTCAPDGTPNQISSTLQRGELHSRKTRKKTKQTNLTRLSTFIGLVLVKYSVQQSSHFPYSYTSTSSIKILLMREQEAKIQTTARLRKSTTSFRTKQKLISTTSHRKYNKPDDCERPSFTTVCSTKTRSFGGGVYRDDDVCRVENLYWICIFFPFFLLQVCPLEFHENTNSANKVV